MHSLPQAMTVAPLRRNPVMVKILSALISAELTMDTAGEAALTTGGANVVSLVATVTTTPSEHVSASSFVTPATVQTRFSASLSVVTMHSLPQAMTVAPLRRNPVMVKVVSALISAELTMETAGEAALTTGGANVVSLVA